MWLESGEFIKAEDLPAFFEKVSHYPAFNTPADKCEKGLALLKKGDKEKAIELLQQAAELGHCGAKYELAKIYIKNKSHVKEAINLFQQSAQQGHPRAQYQLGLCYKNGLGVYANTMEAQWWFGRAAQQGDFRARAELENFNKKEIQSSLQP